MAMFQSVVSNPDYMYRKDTHGSVLLQDTGVLQKVSLSVHSHFANQVKHHLLMLNNTAQSLRHNNGSTSDIYMYSTSPPYRFPFLIPRHTPR